VVELFSKSSPDQYKAKGKPLGLLAELLMMAITAKPDFSFTLLENPLFHSYGSIEQTYIDMIRKAREIDTIGKGE